MIALSYLEFYCGIGGWGYALEHACRSIKHAQSAIMMDQLNHQTKKPKILNPGDDISSNPFHIEAKLLAAYDHSDLCNSVFTHNHASYHKSDHSTKQPFYKPRQTPIERITKQELESHSATIWCMSPPCQPHTRQHSNQHKEVDDPRSKSFLHLCHLLSVMDEDTLPCLILLENVVGFESAWEYKYVDSSAADVDDDDKGASEYSNTKPLTQNASASRGSFAEWRAVLSQRQYDVAHFHLDPTHVGLPNNRPRYYCVAFHREGLLQRLTKTGFTDQRPTLSMKVLGNLFSRENVSKEPMIHNEFSIKNINGKETDTGSNKPDIPPIKCFLDADLDVHTNNNELTTKMKSLQIPEKVRTSSSAWCFDIATPYHTCSSCFTSSYGKYIRGTGSILYTGPLRLNNEDVEKNADSAVPSIERFQLALPEERSYDESWSDDINWDHMRYLSGTEIARLMGFPVSEPAAEINQSTPREPEDDVKMRKFSFPSTCTMKQQWKLLGNSLNVQVAATVAKVGIQAIFNDLAERNSQDN